MVSLHFVKSKRWIVQAGLGIWSSDSGNKFFLFEVQDQLWLVIWRPSGEKKLYKAQWSKGLEGTQFTYQSNKSYTVTINASNPERAIAVGGGRDMFGVKSISLSCLWKPFQPFMVCGKHQMEKDC